MSVHLDSSSHGSFSTSLSRPSSKKYAVLTNEGQLKVSYRTVVVAQTKWESFCQFWRWVFRMGPLTRLETRTIRIQNLPQQVRAGEPEINVIQSFARTTATRPELEAAYDPDSHRVVLTSRIRDAIGDLTITDVSLSPSTRIYDPEGPEVRDFLQALQNSPRLKEKYSEEDWQFIKTIIAPKLLSTRDFLLEEHRKDPTAIHSAKNKTSPYLNIDFSSLSDTSFLKRNSTLSISVRVHPSGLVVFNLPTFRETGGFKSVRLSILSNVSSPDTFRPQMKITLKKEHKTDPAALQDFSAEFRTSTPPHENVGIATRALIEEPSPTRSGSPTLITTAFVDEMVPLTLFRERLPDEVSSTELPHLMDDLFTITQGILTGADHYYKQGRLHNDYKCANILLSMGSDASGRIRVQKSTINDFGLTTRVDDDAANTGDFGTDGYYVPGQRKSLSSEIYGLGKTFQELLGHYEDNQGPAIVDASISHSKQILLTQLRKRTFEQLFDIFENMTATRRTSSTGFSGQRVYDNASCTFSGLLSDLAAIQGTFNEQMQRISSLSEEEAFQEYCSMKLNKQFTKLEADPDLSPAASITAFLPTYETIHTYPARATVDVATTFTTLKRAYIQRYTTEIFLPQKESYLAHLRHLSDTGCNLKELQEILKMKTSLQDRLRELSTAEEAQSAAGDFAPLRAAVQELIQAIAAFERDYLARAQTLEEARTAVRTHFLGIPMPKASARARIEPELERLKTAIRSSLPTLDDPHRAYMEAQLDDETLYKLLKHRGERAIYVTASHAGQDATMILRGHTLLVAFNSGQTLRVRWPDSATA
jgi:DNA-binding transcriptional MerR regulator